MSNTKETAMATDKMIRKLFSHWELSESECSQLMPNTDTETALLLEIHSMLRVLYPYDKELCYSWMKCPNRAFGDRAPLEAMLNGDSQGVYKYLAVACTK